jgi:hypothetical protein
MKKGTLLAAAAVLLLIPALSQAQVLTPVSNVTLNAALAESISVSLTGVSTVNFTLVPGAAAAGDSPVAIQSSWVLKPGRTEVKLVGYFDTTNALTDAGPPSADIASANVFGRVTTGSPGTFTAFTQTVASIGTAGASLLLVDEMITGTNKNKTRTDNLDLQIDLTSAPQQPAGTYTGVLRIQAIVL